jgi:hypothetical protein
MHGMAAAAAKNNQPMKEHADAAHRVSEIAHTATEHQSLPPPKGLATQGPGARGSTTSMGKRAPESSSHEGMHFGQTVKSKPGGFKFGQ